MHFLFPFGVDPSHRCVAPPLGESREAVDAKSSGPPTLCTGVPSSPLGKNASDSNASDSEVDVTFLGTEAFVDPVWCCCRSHCSSMEVVEVEVVSRSQQVLRFSCRHRDGHSCCATKTDLTLRVQFMFPRSEQSSRVTLCENFAESVDSLKSQSSFHDTSFRACWRLTFVMRQNTCCNVVMDWGAFDGHNSSKEIPQVKFIDKDNVDVPVAFHRHNTSKGSFCARQEGGLFCVLVSRSRCPARDGPLWRCQTGSTRCCVGHDPLPSVGQWFLVASRLRAVPRRQSHPLSKNLPAHQTNSPVQRPSPMRSSPDVVTDAAYARVTALEAAISALGTAEHKAKQSAPSGGEIGRVTPREAGGRVRTCSSGTWIWMFQ